MDKKYLFFDTASTTKCSEAAAQFMLRYAVEEYGNPSSSHFLGERAMRPIREAREFFARTFRVSPEQVIFTGSGTEANNLALSGIALAGLQRGPVHVFTSEAEHPSVREPAKALQQWPGKWNVHLHTIPVDRDGQIQMEALLEQLDEALKEAQRDAQHHPQHPVPTFSVSIQQVNSITGALLPVEAIAKQIKARLKSEVAKAAHLIFHTDSVQAFGKVPVPHTAVDLVSLSAHKICGPKGIGALIVLNKNLLHPSKLQPIIRGGEQEGGFRSGTQNAGLIGAFHIAAQEALAQQEQNQAKVHSLYEHLKSALSGVVHWNSPPNSSDSAVPNIVNISVKGLAAGPFTKLLEERGCLVSVGSACSSKKPEPDPTLKAMGLSPEIQKSAFRISLNPSLEIQDVDTLVQALKESVDRMIRLQGPLKSRPKSPQDK